MKFLVLVVAVLYSTAAFSEQKVDLEVNMKNTGLAYKNTVQAVSLDDFNKAIDKFIALVENSKKATFHKEAKMSLKGLDKVIAQAKLAKKLANERGLDAAKPALKNIDDLRKEYHKLHEPPGFFDLLFGN
ncbi:cytochrome b562 [uncultured Pseudoalteromonas sp.]|uniref:cytochrome b562 n=1 Tax=uncultured Pseudoalteromonas sp. TaxID=114053 RepID=UPI0030C8894A